MSTSAGAPADTGAEQLWAEEPSHLAGHARIRARIAGLHCSLCTGTIEKALGRQPGVDKVAVSLTHEQALVDYDPALIGPQDILTTLRDIGYDLYDPRKLRPFEEEEADLVREGKRLLAAIAASLTAIALILEVSGLWSILVPASVVALMVPVSYAILNSAGRARAALGALAIIAPAAVDIPFGWKVYSRCDGRPRSNEEGTWPTSSQTTPRVRWTWRSVRPASSSV